MQPHQYPRRILLVVTGKTPQIVTETLYKLAVSGTPAFVPTEIHLITTEEGKKSAKIALLGIKEGRGIFHRFCRDFAFSGITFNEHTIHVISDTEGTFLSDEQSTYHNRIASDFITAKVREFTLDENSALHLSLAGGRKTMSFYAGYALSLYGRLQDRLSHVLVNEPFQNNPDFFYPRPIPECMAVNNSYHSTEDAVIILSDIPYVRMRYQLPESLLTGRIGFQETVEIIQRFAQPETIMVDIPARRLELNGVEVAMSAADLAFYLWMCLRKIENEPPLIPDEDAFMPDYLRVYSLMVSEYSGMYERVEKVSMEKTAEQQKSWFLQRKSKTRKCVEEILGSRAARPFLIQTVARDDRAAYEIMLPVEAITVKGEG